MVLSLRRAGATLVLSRVLAALMMMAIAGHWGTASSQTLAAAAAPELPEGSGSTDSGYDRGGWMGSMVAGGGQFHGCMVKQDPPVLTGGKVADNATIFFGFLQTPDSQWTMVFAKSGGLKVNVRWAMTVLIDDQAVHDGTAIVGNKGVAILEPPLSAEAIASLRTGSTLTIQTERGASQYSLTGSSDALAYAEACVTEIVAGASADGAPADLQAQVQVRSGLRLGAGQTGLNKSTLELPASTIAAKPTAYTGTGFMATAVGHLLTNAHVVNGCSLAEATLPGQAPQTVRVLARDTVNDLALLSPLTDTFVNHPPLRGGARTGEPVAAYGFPYAGLLPSQGNFTLGNVTATAGLQDDARYLQMSAPIQPGSSGGPLLDQAGNMVGIVVARLNPKAEGGGAQNVNFAIKADVVAEFLVANGLSETDAPSAAAMPAADLADAAKTFTVFIACKSDPAVAAANAANQQAVAAGLTSATIPAQPIRTATADPARLSDQLAAFLMRPAARTLAPRTKPTQRKASAKAAVWEKQARYRDLQWR